jgi:uncharacterized membrane protein YfcA
LENLLTLPFGIVDALLIFVIVATASALQASLGFGLGLLAAPLLVLIHPAFIPGPLIAAGIVLTLRVAYSERTQVDWAGLRYLVAGRFVGSSLAAGVLSLLSQRVFDGVFGCLVLVAVGLSFGRARVVPSAGKASLAGVLSGFMSTLSSIGGPPTALLYQSASPARLRGTLSAQFVVGGFISIAALASIGRYAGDEIVLSLYLVPPMLVGLGVATRLHWLLEGGRARPLVLALSSCAALAVLHRALS